MSDDLCPVCRVEDDDDDDEPESEPIVIPRTGTMSTSNQAQADPHGIGKVIPDGAMAYRDAIHVAIAPAVAGEKLYPGQDVIVINGVACSATAGRVGIVDPFLSLAVYPEQRFWVFLIPGSITSLRHEWTHPAFDDAGRLDAGIKLPAGVQVTELGTCTASDAWIREFAGSVGLEYDELMSGARDWLAHGEFLNRGELLYDVDLLAGFWEHYAIATGRMVPASKRQNFFSCSC